MDFQIRGLETEERGTSAETGARTGTDVIILKNSPKKNWRKKIGDF
jgi:hypothetical protein